jgi:hypothetical protein
VKELSSRTVAVGYADAVRSERKRSEDYCRADEE